MEDLHRMNNEPELLSCPFCGGKKLQKLQTFKDEIKFIRCESCQFGWIAVEDWNRRVQGSVAASTDDTKRLLKASNDLREYLEGMPLLESFDVPDKIWEPFTNAIDAAMADDGRK